MALSTRKSRIVSNTKLVQMSAGIVTQDVVQKTKASWNEPRVPFALCDFRASVWAVLPRDLTDYCLGLPMPQAGAYIVSEANVALFKRHSMQLAEEGICFKTFTQPSVAKAWLAQQMVLHDAASAQVLQVWEQCHPGRTAPPPLPAVLDLLDL